MTYDDLKQHHRRSIRAKRYDYATCGAYFVTICTHGRQSLLGEIRGGIVGLSEVGCMVQSVWNDLPLRYAKVEIDSFVVMPNHVHGIIVLVGSGQARGPAPTSAPDLSVGADLRVRPPTAAGEGAPTLPMVVQRFKSFTTHRHGEMLWQRNYFEHIVRDDRDVARIRQYIDGNPIRWSLDCENPHRTGDDEFDRWLKSFKSPVGAGSHARPPATSP